MDVIDDPNTKSPPSPNAKEHSRQLAELGGEPLEGSGFENEQPEQDFEE